MVLIVGWNYETYRNAAEIFKNRNQKKSGTIRKLLQKFKTCGDVINDDMEFDITISPIEQKILAKKSDAKSY